MATLGERVEEKERQLEKTIKKMEQLKEQVKQLKIRKQESDRKERTHNLIVCGAEIAAIYGGHVLNLDEVHVLVNHLREEKENGVFDIVIDDCENLSSADEMQEIENAKNETAISQDILDMFNF